MEDQNLQTEINPDEAKKFVDSLNQQGEVTPEKRHRFNLKDAYDALHKDLDSGTKLGEEQILEYHRLLAQNIPVVRRGSYSRGIRTIDNLPWEVDPFPMPEDTPELMKQYASFLGEAVKYHPETPKEYVKLIDKAAQAMIKFVDIHPFGDGNGRTSRLLADAVLISGGLYQMPHWLEPEVSDVLKARHRFFLMIGTARKYGDYRLLLRFFTRQQLLALNMELEAIEVNTQAMTEAKESGYFDEKVATRNVLEDFEDALSTSIIENPPKALPSKK
jgi:hypothetical protein